MAASKKKAPQKNTGRSAVTPRKRKSNPLIIEMIAMASIAIGIFLIISVYSKGVTGYVGELVSEFFKGLFGLGAYILPFIIIGVSLYFLFAKIKDISNSRTIAGIFLFLCIISLAHLWTMDQDVSYSSFIDYLSANFESGGLQNGGLLGAVFGNFLFGLMGKAGAYIVLFTIGIVTTILLTGKSLFETLKYGVSWLQDYFSSRTDYDDEYDDDIYADEVLPEPKPRVKKTDYSSQRSDELPEIRPRRKKKEGKTFVIEDRSGIKEKPKILLVSEERKAVKKHNPVMSPRKSALESLIPSSDKNELLEIRVKGLVEESPDCETIEEVISQNDEMLPDLPEPFWVDYKEPEWQEEFIEEVSAASEPDDTYPEADEILPVIEHKAEQVQYEYIFPSIDMLTKSPNINTMSSRAQILENSRKLEDTLKSFGVEAKVVEVSKGPTVTRYELSPGAGVKVSKISSLADDLALNLAAVGIRIEAPIPGKAAVGIEIPNKEVQQVYLREVLDDDLFIKYPSKLAFALGKDIAGNTVVWDIAKMPHLLIAGATGAGKSVCINTLITSIIYKARPDEVKLLMVDPKVVELSVYNGIPHLLIPVVTDPKKAAGALNWAVAEMINRYNLFAETGVRDLKGYNAFKTDNGETDLLPQIVIIIDELADLMMAAPGEVEDAICRLAQMARAAGLHLIIATQRPSVDVITGLIKANVPSRLAFAVSSGTDSRTILDMVGAEKLLGKGDMLFCPVGMGKPLRIQGAFISDKEVEGIVNFLKTQVSQEYSQDMIEKITSTNKVNTIDGEVDEFFDDAITFVIQKEKASASMLQRQFRIGYNRASRLIEDLESRGIIGPEDGSKPRKVLMTMYQWNELRSE